MQQTNQQRIKEKKLEKQNGSLNRILFGSCL